MQTYRANMYQFGHILAHVEVELSTEIHNYILDCVIDPLFASGKAGDPGWNRKKMSYI